MFRSGGQLPDLNPAARRYFVPAIEYSTVAGVTPEATAPLAIVIFTLAVALPVLTVKLGAEAAQ